VANPTEPLQKELDYVSAPADEAWTQFEQLAGDSRYTPEHKRQQIAEIGQQAAREVEARLTYQTDTLTTKADKLRIAARQSIAPSPEQAPQLVYVRDALAARWPSMDGPALYADWRAALAVNDLLTARVYRDYLLPHVQPKARNGADYSHVIPGEYTRLAARTDELLSTPEQRQAAAELVKVEATLQRLKWVAEESRARLSSAALSGDSKTLVDRRIGSRFRL
jgi:hypothetical protein